MLNRKEEKHKLKHGFSSNSEDALTWSCFDTLKQQSHDKIAQALNEIMEDAFEGKKGVSFENEQEIKIEIGKNYSSQTTQEKTEVDASFETSSSLIFIEAKLYSKISLSEDYKPHDQIIRKMRIGLDCEEKKNKAFYFIFLDIAPMDKVITYGEEKAISAEYFKNYKEHNELLEIQLIPGSFKNIKTLSENMGWLTWASVFKTVLRVIIK